MTETDARVFVDMDDVLCAFIAGVSWRLPRSVCRGRYWPKGEYDVAKVLGMPAEDIWRRLEPHDEFFASLPWTKEGKVLWAWLWCNLDPRELWLLSMPLPGMGSRDGKKRWIERHLHDISPGQVHRAIITHEPKANYAAPGRLLIDDCDANVDPWRAAGGEAILVPRLCNSGEGDAFDVVKAGVLEWKRSQREGQLKPQIHADKHR